MKRTTVPQKLIQAYSVLSSRAELAARMGIQFDGDRDLYSALGYPRDITYADYFAKFKRLDIANAVINRPVDATWKGTLQVMETKKANTTAFETAFDKLVTDLRLKSKFKRVDRLTGIGQYGILFLGFDDAKSSVDFAKEVQAGTRKLLYVKPLGQNDATIHSYVTDTTNSRYGMPLQYNIKITSPDGSSNATYIVHYTRILHVVDTPTDAEFLGTPRLEAIYNRLMDLEKLIGGSSEMYWRGARPGYTGTVNEKFQMGTVEKEALQSQIDEYEHNLRRILINEGVDLQALTQAVHDPDKHVDVQLMMISAVSRIPKRILTGSERGELSSSQDSDEWYSYIQDRREEFAEESIVRPFIDICIKYKVLPAPKSEYSVVWSNLLSQSEKDKAEVGKLRSEALKNYVGQALSPDAVVPPDAFFELFLGLTPDQIELINSMVGQMPKEERELEEIEEEDDEQQSTAE